MPVSFFWPCLAMWGQFCSSRPAKKIEQQVKESNRSTFLYLISRWARWGKWWKRRCPISCGGLTLMVQFQLQILKPYYHGTLFINYALSDWPWHRRVITKPKTHCSTEEKQQHRDHLESLPTWYIYWGENISILKLIKYSWTSFTLL